MLNISPWLFARIPWLRPVAQSIYSRGASSRHVGGKGKIIKLGSNDLTNDANPVWPAARPLCWRTSVRLMYMHEAGGPGHIPLLFFMHELGHSKGHRSHRFHWSHLCLPTLISQGQPWSTIVRYCSNPTQTGWMIWLLHIIIKGYPLSLSIYICFDSYMLARLQLVLCSPSRALHPVLSINNGRESEGGDKGFFVSSFWFFSIVVGWRKLSRLSRLSRLCALVRELTEIDGQSSAGSHPWLEASSFHLSSYSSYTPVLFLLYLSCLNSAYAPFFIPQSHMITALQACRIKGFKGHKLSSEWIFFRRELSTREEYVVR